MNRKIINIGNVGTSTRFGSDDLDYINKLLTGVDQSSSDPVQMATTWEFRDQKLQIVSTDTSGLFNYIIKASTLTNDRLLTLPVLSANDTFAFLAATQTLTNKTIDYNSNTILNLPASSVTASNTVTFTNKSIDGGTNTLTNIPKGALSAVIVATDQANTYGDFLQILRQLRLKLMNPANTFGYLFNTSAITADRTILLPLLAGNDTMVFEAFSQTLTNKTIDFNSNTCINFPGSTPGEANTASNVGTAGVGVFDAKVLLDLQLRKLNPLSSKLSIALDAANKKIDFDITEANLNLANQGGTISNSQVNTSAAIAWTKISKAGSQLADIADTTIASPGTGNYLRYDAGTSKWVNTVITLPDIANIIVETSPADNHILYKSGSTYVNRHLQRSKYYCVVFQDSDLSSTTSTIPIYAVKWDGSIVASGTSGTDDATVIQAAINAADGKGTCYIAPAKYRPSTSYYPAWLIPSAIDMNSVACHVTGNLHVSGYPQMFGSTILRKTHTGKIIDISTNTNGVMKSLSNLLLLGGNPQDVSDTNRKTGTGIDWHHSRQEGLVGLDHVYVGWCDIGVKLQDIAYFIMRDTTIDQCATYGLNLSQSASPDEKNKYCILR